MENQNRKYPPKYNPGFVKPEHITTPRLTVKDREDFERGIQLFNNGMFWHAHEAWEEVWKRQWAPNRLFFQGLIHMTAAYHQLYCHKYHGLIKHCERATLKLELFRPEFLGINVDFLLQSIGATRTLGLQLGEERLHEFDVILIPAVLTERSV